MARIESTANARVLDKLKDKGISQRKFAAMIGMSTNGFHAIAKGETRVSKVLALAAQSLLGISAEWILNGEGDSEINQSIVSIPGTGFYRFSE